MTIPLTPTLRDTMTSMLETAEITDNIRADATLTDSEKQELIDNILSPTPQVMQEKGREE